MTASARGRRRRIKSLLSNVVLVVWTVGEWFACGNGCARKCVQSRQWICVGQKNGSDESGLGFGWLRRLRCEWRRRDGRSAVRKAVVSGEWSCVMQCEWSGEADGRMYVV